MYNYEKNGVKLDAQKMQAINRYNEIMRKMSAESMQASAEKKELEKKIENAINDKNAENAKTLQAQLNKVVETWNDTKKAYNLELFGGKVDGKKVDGICDFITDDLYKAYVAFISDYSKRTKYRTALKNFVLDIIEGDTLKEGAYNHFFNDIMLVMSSTKFNSTAQIAQGAAYITTINKQLYKKMLCGAICDIVANNRTLKVAKNTKKDGKKGAKKDGKKGANTAK